jgi:hypothetical protein
MADDADKPEQPSILHRPISNRGMEILLVTFAISALIFILISPVTCSDHGHPQWLHDLANTRQIIVTMHGFAADHGGHLPVTMLYTEDYLGDEDVFHSRYDHEASLVFDETPEPGWYQYGSYWFLSEPGLTIYAEDADEIMLAYRTPRMDHEYYIVGFLDGSAETLTIDAFEKQKKEHDKRLLEQNTDTREEPN